MSRKVEKSIKNAKKTTNAPDPTLAQINTISSPSSTQITHYQVLCQVLFQVESLVFH
jgi:hypothetical protein